MDLISSPFASALLGGILIGLSATGLLLCDGKIAGISGIVGGLLKRSVDRDTAWRAAFVAGLVAGGLLLRTTAPELIADTLERSLPAIVVAGVLVGYGTRLGSGCTSGHGVCGISRGSVRSISATVVFMSVAAAVTFVVNHLLGGRL